MKIVKEYPSTDTVYRIVLRLLSAFIEEDKRLTSTEEEIMLFILSVKKPLEGKVRGMLCTQLMCSTQSLSGHLKRIRSKGWLDEHNELDPVLQTLQDSVSKGFEFNVTIKHG